MQLRQTSVLVAAIEVEYVPGTQFVQVNEAALDHEPPKHEPHAASTFAPDMLLAVPAGQFKHVALAIAPTLVEYVPGWQVVHKAEALTPMADDHVPVGHERHPAALVLDVSVEYVPATQLTQVRAEAADHDPGWHGAQMTLVERVAAVWAYIPAAHTGAEAVQRPAEKK